MTCSCCGGYCETQDPGQDTGFGFCESCAQWIIDRENAKLDDLATKIEARLNPANRAKLRAMSVDKRRAVALRAMNDGLVTYSIRGR